MGCGLLWICFYEHLCDWPMDDEWHFCFESWIILVMLEGRRNL